MLSQLVLQHFRSYSKESFALVPTTTVIVGPNAAGKTNILEAIYLLSSGKSFRAETDREMIAYGEELARVTGKITSGDATTTSLEVVVTTGQVQGKKAPYKKYLLDGVAKRMVDFAGNLRVVVFWPQDLELVTASPSRRRKYLDSVLSQVDWEYRRTLMSYERGLRSRNSLLERIREGEASRGELPYWNQLLIKQGGYITGKREEFIQFFNSSGKTIDEAAIEIIYDHSVISESRLEQYKVQEVAAAATLVGPHRDDFNMVISRHSGKPEGRIQNRRSDSGQARMTNSGGRNLHAYGSRGEQRLAVLWLKLAELEYIEKQVGERPILLLDDIFSELDQKHRAVIMDIVPRQQTVITTTDSHLRDMDRQQTNFMDVKYLK